MLPGTGDWIRWNSRPPPRRPPAAGERDGPSGLFCFARPGGAKDCHPPPRRGGRATSSLFHGFRSPPANSTRGYNPRPRRGRTTHRALQLSAPLGPKQYSPRRGWNRLAQGRAQRRPGEPWSPRSEALKARNNDLHECISETRPSGSDSPSPRGRCDRNPSTP